MPPPSGGDEIFEDFPFLTSVVDQNNCDGTVITVYEQGAFSFIHVQTNSEGVLYFQDGTRYCTDGNNFDCVEAYGFGAAIRTWECGSTVPPPPPSGSNPEVFEDFPFLTSIVVLDNCEGTVVTVYEQGVFNFIHVQTTNEGVLYFQDGTRYCQDAVNFDCLVAYGLDNPISRWECGEGSGGGSTTLPPLFEDNPWLESVVDIDDCGQTVVTVYQSGAFRFFFIDDGSGLMTMYNETGLFYCQDAPGFSCLAVYGFEQSDLVDSWRCENLENDTLEEREIKQKQKEVAVYPNPTTGQIWMDGLQQGQIQLYDINGAMMLEEEIVNTKMQVDLSEFAAGIYLLVLTDEGYREIRQVVKL